jgi:WD40 repeat protein
MFQGTPSYTSAVDVWAAGVMTIQILAGIIPSLKQLEDYGGLFYRSRFDPFAREVNVSSQAQSFVRRLIVQRPDGRPNATQCSEDPWLQTKAVSPENARPRILGMGRPSIKARPARKKPTVARNDSWLSTSPFTPRGPTAKPTTLFLPSALRPATAVPIRGMSRSPRPAQSLFAKPGFPHCSVSKFKSRTYHQGVLLDGHTAPVNAMVWDEDGEQLASASEDKTVRIWEPSTHRVSTLQGHSKAVRAIAFDDGGMLFASASDDGTILIWEDLPSGWSYRGILEGHGGPVVSVSFSHDDKRLVSASSDRTVVEWDVATMRKVRTVKKFEFPVVSARCSRENDSLAVICGGGSFDRALCVQVWTKDKSDRKRHYWTMHRNHSFSSPVFSAFVLKGDELFAATSRGLVFKDEDSTEDWRIDSECVIRAVLFDEPDDCMRLAGSDWVAALQPLDVDNGSPFTVRRHGTPYAQGVATSDLLWVNGPVPSANDVQINPDSGETAFAFQGENSIFVLTKVPEPPKMRKRR